MYASMKHRQVIRSKMHSAYFSSLYLTYEYTEIAGAEKLNKESLAVAARIRCPLPIASTF